MKQFKLIEEMLGIKLTFHQKVILWIQNKFSTKKQKQKQYKRLRDCIEWKERQV